MSDIFISYSSKDIEHAKRFADALEEQGWSVFWDRTIPAGKTWRQYLQAELVSARCVIVLWTSNAVMSHWVGEEAEVGRRSGILVPAFVEDVEPPIGFQSIQAAKLIGWDGDTSDPEFGRFVEDVRQIVDAPEASPAGSQKQTEAAATRKAPAKPDQVKQSSIPRKSNEETQEKPEKSGVSNDFIWGIVTAIFILIVLIECSGC